MKEKPLLQCHLLVMGITAALAEAVPRLPALETLMSGGWQGPAFEGGAEAWLCDRFGVPRQQDYPVAALCALADGLSPGNRAWLRADPVHFALLRDSLVLAAAASDLAMEETDALLATLNAHFAADGFQFSAPAADRWYVSFDHPLGLRTRALPEALGGVVDAMMPQGEDAPRWRGWLNEAQMLLHDHAVNTAREARGDLVVNSIWPWGGGTLPNSVETLHTAVWAEDPLARGLGLQAGLAVQPLPQTATDWLDGAQEGNHLLVLDIRTEAGNANAGRPAEILQQLERDWFEPLRAGVRRGNLAGATLHLSGLRRTRTCHMAPADRWKFWRRRRPLKNMIHD